jgi:hypothetical protein
MRKIRISGSTLDLKASLRKTAKMKIQYSVKISAIISSKTTVMELLLNQVLLEPMSTQSIMICKELFQIT